MRDCISWSPEVPSCISRGTERCLQRLLARLNEAELVVALIIADTGESRAVVCIGGICLSFLDSFWWLWNGNAEKGSSGYYQPPCSACLCLEFGLWREARGVSLNESLNAVEQRSLLWNSFVKLALLFVTLGICACWILWCNWDLFLVEIIWMWPSCFYFGCYLEPWELVSGGCLHWTGAKQKFDKTWVPSICSL